MAMQIQEIKNMASWLKTLGYPLSEEYQAIALLTALPDEWDNICDTILNQSRSFTVQGTVNTLLEHETILKDKQQNALLTCHGHKSKPGTSNPKSKGTGHPMCTNCNHQGHMIERCWDVGGGAEGQGPKGNKSMSDSKKKGKKDETVKAASGSQPPSPPISSLKFFIAHSSEALMSQGTSNPNHTYIYLNSGASTHMCVEAPELR